MDAWQVIDCWSGCYICSGCCNLSYLIMATSKDNSKANTLAYICANSKPINFAINVHRIYKSKNRSLVRGQFFTFVDCVHFVALCFLLSLLLRVRRKNNDKTITGFVDVSPNLIYTSFPSSIPITRLRNYVSFNSDQSPVLKFYNTWLILITLLETIYLFLQNYYQ